MPITHMDLDSFFVSVECLENSKLKGKPLLIGGSGDRAVVASCSYEARSFGIHSAMPMQLARKLCPDAIIIRGDMDKYTRYSELVTSVINERAPLYEKASIDEFYLDLCGMDRFFGCYQWASELKQRIRNETGLNVSFGLSENKTVSKIATGEVKPNGQMQVENGNEKTFLAPLHVRKIPMVGEKNAFLLKSMGIEKIHTLQEMPIELMENLMGQTGISIWKKANGIDNTPVVPYSERKSISSEETFEKDTIDVYKLNAILVGMTEQLGFQLRDSKKLCACVAVKIRYSDFDTHTMQARIPYTSCDHILIARVKELFKKLYNRRLLVRLIGVRFSHLVQGNYQINLFEDTSSMISLYQAIDRMKQRFGADKIQRAIGLEKYKM
jgi:DNA polymerase-4